MGRAVDCYVFRDTSFVCVVGCISWRGQDKLLNSCCIAGVVGCCVFGLVVGWFAKKLAYVSLGRVPDTLAARARARAASEMFRGTDYGLLVNCSERLINVALGGPSGMKQFSIAFSVLNGFLVGCLVFGCSVARGDELGFGARRRCMLVSVRYRTRCVMLIDLCWFDRSPARSVMRVVDLKFLSFRGPPPASDDSLVGNRQMSCYPVTVGESSCRRHCLCCRRQDKISFLACGCPRRKSRRQLWAAECYPHQCLLCCRCVAVVQRYGSVTREQVVAVEPLVARHPRWVDCWHLDDYLVFLHNC